MASQKQKNYWYKFFVFLNSYQPITQIIKPLNYLDSSRPYGNLSENKKTGGFRELFLSKNDFKTFSAVNFRQKASRIWILETNQRYEI